MIEYIGQPYLRSWMLRRMHADSESDLFDHPNGLICLGNRSIKGHLLGVVGYDSWTGKSCTMHMVGDPGWLTKSFMWAAFDYPFNQAKCELVLGRISTGNKPTIDLTLRIGFHMITTVPDVYPDGDEVILGMYKSECKWLEIKHG